MNMAFFNLTTGIPPFHEIYHKIVKVLITQGQGA